MNLELCVRKRDPTSFSSPKPGLIVDLSKDMNALDGIEEMEVMAASVFMAETLTH
jgi:hypothetical protein